MHLKQLKLSGFKSFVDPTSIYFPSQLVAVVGPNGCGKSNIIDAVRWVLGESSAKNLRGESMVDVIFNGSSNRKAVGQASVELIFDNSLGRITGPFASYGEVSLKRLVSRDGDSSYFLNGSKCRKRDITDIFLGTGAGARGYSIIGQGTISKLIEAKPEELRVFLEEAAGVSKYKERRHETLLRLGHTKENMTRVADIREELDKQLQRLERQAKSAEKYLHYKEEEKLCRMEILALKWKEYSTLQNTKQKEIQELAIAYEQQQTHITGLQTQRIVVQQQVEEANNNTQDLQSVFYQIATDIARLEETLQQQEKEKIRLEQEKQRLQEDWQRAEEQIKQDREEHTLSTQKEQTFNQDLHQKKTEFIQQETRWQELQHKYQDFDARWQEVQIKRNALENELRIEALNQEHMEQKRQQAMLRIEKIKEEQEELVLDKGVEHQKELEAKHAQLQEQLQFDEEQLESANEQLNSVRSQSQEAEINLHRLQDEYHQINSECSALMAAQKAAKLANKANKEGIKDWADKQRLMDIIKVEEPWQTVCEMVLADSLHAYVLDDFTELWPRWNECIEFGESVVSLNTSQEDKNSRLRLVDKIKSAIPHTLNNLNHIYIAQDLEEAQKIHPTLLDYESIVTSDGLWLGRGWVRFVSKEEQDESGFIMRQQKINELALYVEHLREKLEIAKNTRDQLHKEVEQKTHYLSLCQLNVKASYEALNAHTIALKEQEQALTHAHQRRERLEIELEELYPLIEDAAEQLMLLKDKKTLMKQQFEEYDGLHNQFVDEKETWLASIELQKSQTESLRSQIHQTEMETERERTKLNQINDRIKREEERLKTTQERLEQIVHQSMELSEPSLELKEKLQGLIVRHREIEEKLRVGREHSAQLKVQLEDTEKLIAQHEKELGRIQEGISQGKIEENSLMVRAAALQESLDEFEVQADELLEHISLEVTQSMREDDLIKINNKIKNLGAINLAAIEEFETEQQRKIYLDEQYNDLHEALLTLEAAIEKMDKETRLRLENTFEEVNTSFKALFPRLFGGGRAQLELTCDNLLEAGIVVMAQPPGKRNSTIHLLSGGEKAMTAVALVFAIFQLNPSPFCMLDEVDAPLDDVNVGRFCDLVKEMSQYVQFLFITHNKVTMELADHLIGVTMREPGVSRLVTVDVKQALTME